MIFLLCSVDHFVGDGSVGQIGDDIGHPLSEDIGITGGHPPGNLMYSSESIREAGVADTHPDPARRVGVDGRPLLFTLRAGVADRVDVDDRH